MSLTQGAAEERVMVMAKRLPDDAKQFRPVAEGRKRAENLTRVKTAPIDPLLVRTAIAEGYTTPQPTPAPPAAVGPPRITSGRD